MEPCARPNSPRSPVTDGSSDCSVVINVGERHTEPWHAPHVHEAAPLGSPLSPVHRTRDGYDAYDTEDTEDSRREPVVPARASPSSRFRKSEPAYLEEFSAPSVSGSISDVDNVVQQGHTAVKHHRRSATMEDAGARKMERREKKYMRHARARSADMAGGGINPFGALGWLTGAVAPRVLQEMVDSVHKGDDEDNRPAPPDRPTPTLNSGDMENVSTSSLSDLGSDTDTCAMCLCHLGDGLCTVEPCGHVFHTECMFTFFSKCSVRDCPMCRGTVASLRKHDGEVLMAEALKRLFKVSCYGVRFSQASHSTQGGAAVESFFKVPSQVKRLKCSVEESGGEEVRHLQIPPVALQLLDSDGNLQTSHGEVYVNVFHSSATGTIAPDSVYFTNGVALFDGLHCAYRPDKKRPNLLAIKFMIEAPGHMVHHKALFAGVRTSSDCWISMRGRVIGLSLLFTVLVILAVVLSLSLA